MIRASRGTASDEACGEFNDVMSAEKYRPLEQLGRGPIIPRLPGLYSGTPLLSSRGPGHSPLKAVTRVRIP
jgi:hypothetical protein